MMLLWHIQRRHQLRMRPFKNASSRGAIVTKITPADLVCLLCRNCVAGLHSCDQTSNLKNHFSFPSKKRTQSNTAHHTTPRWIVNQHDNRDQRPTALVPSLTLYWGVQHAEVNTCLRTVKGGSTWVSSHLATHSFSAPVRLSTVKPIYILPQPWWCLRWVNMYSIGWWLYHYIHALLLWISFVIFFTPPHPSPSTTLYWRP